MKYFIIAGEASGDLHSANLAKAIKAIDHDASFEGWGGDQMMQSGVLIKKHIRDLAFMGFIEVLLNLRTIMKNFRLCKQQILTFRPDVIILTDYPGFNLRMAKWARKNNIRSVYYISPQVWAWKTSRVKNIRRDVETMLTILPFEKPFYSRFGMEVQYVGHPLVDAVDSFKIDPRYPDIPSDKPVLLLFPGSRRQELKKILPEMLRASKAFKETHRLVIAGVSHLPRELYPEESENITVIFDSPYPLFSIANAAFVKSGTSTLEAALFKVPQVVCYKANPISVMIARWLIGRKIKFISLVNLIADKEICRELIQDELNQQNMVAEMNKLIFNQEERNKMLSEYELLYTKLGGSGASARAAASIIKTIQP